MKATHSIASTLLCLSLLLTSLATQAQGLQQLRQRAANGDVQAQFELAEHYYHSSLATRNYTEAIKWYRAAAGQGYAEAQYQMGYLHQHGPEIVSKDDKLAFDWYLKAARQGHVSAQTKISLMYRIGKGVEKNLAEAQKWSMQVLKSKGLIDEPEASPAKSAVQKARQRKPARQTKPAAGTNAKPVATPPVPSGKNAPTRVAEPAMSPEQRKAWRREQARKLVEKMNRESAEVGSWSDIDE